MAIELIGAPASGKSTILRLIRHGDEFSEWLGELPAASPLDHKRIKCALARYRSYYGVMDEGIWQSGVSLGLSFGREVAEQFFEHAPVPDGVIYCTAPLETVKRRNRDRKRKWKGDIDAAAEYAALGAEIAGKRGIPVLTLDTTQTKAIERATIADWMGALND